MGVKMGWIQIKMGHPLAQSGAALAPIHANGAHPSNSYVRSCCMDKLGAHISSSAEVCDQKFVPPCFSPPGVGK